MIRTSRLAIACALGSALAGTACVDLVGADARFVQREEKRFQVTGQPTVDLSTFDGSIEIRPWDKAEVLVIVEKRAADKADADRIEVRADQSGNRVSVEVRDPHDGSHFRFGWGRSAKLIVSVPAKTDLVAKSGDGSIDVERIAGHLELRSGDGGIRGRDLEGDLRVHTGDGSIKIDGLNGALDADTGDGSINAAGRLAAVRARSGDGSVTIHAAAGSAASGDWDVVTGDGSVVVEVPDGFGAEVDAHAGSGSVRLQDVTLSNVSGRLSRNDVKGTLGSGGRSMRLRSGDGSITLRRGEGTAGNRE
ncbi:MAG TPA: DUF4097 family beta strand repeat-containing protein [Vicinamibacterales bacterium]|nr:DUF4097 family beta strand repeat-containing protein [Vicinamibacterales bacterium]